MDKIRFGTMKDGRDASLFTLTNRNGMRVSVTDYGAAAVSLLVPDKTGGFLDVIRGFDDVSGYENTVTYMGATIGRHAGQIKNAAFELNGKTYNLAVNERDYNLHGGSEGFNSRLFAMESFTERELVLSYLSKDGESGFPGNLKVLVAYSLSDDNALGINFNGCCDQDTILSMTNHAYFNLNGPESASAMDHMLMIYAENYTEADYQGLPTGRIIPVSGTPYDFREFHVIGDRINEPHPELIFCKGYDHNWIISPECDRSAMRICCELKSPGSLIHMQVFSNQPGLQMYSGNYMDGADIGKCGVVYTARSSICLEPQVCPNGLHIPHFPSPVLKKGEEYIYRSMYRFLV